MEDTDGNIVSQATNDAEGNITFNIPYTTEDVGNSYTYTAHEVIPDETFGITYDKTVFTVSVDVSADNGKLTGSVNIADHDSMIFNNTYAASTDIIVSGKKVLTGRDFRDTDKWTFTLDGEGPKPAETSVEIYPAQGDEFSFTIPFSVSDMDGQRTKDFEYTVTESGFVPLVANDTSVKSFTVRITDEGTGVMKAEIVDADNLDLTFTNRALVTLPMTGSMTSIWIMLAGLLVIAAGYAYSRKRKGDLAE
jgi:pilin isopeptide linkage protein/LPXTG-motif cell wall-anchored protein